MKYSFYIFSVLLFFSCEDGLIIDDLLSSDKGEQIPITTLLDSELNFTNSTISLNWEGNDYAISFSYRLESLDYLDPVTTYTEWSEWDSLTTVTFKDMPWYVTNSTFLMYKLCFFKILYANFTV